MASPMANRVLSETILQGQGAALRAKQVALVVAGIAALAIAAKIKVPFWPVPMTMQTFAVLLIGAAYGTRLGMGTVLAYLALGALGADVFTASDSGSAGIAYMLGGTGGYLVGFALAAGLVGHLARRGWDRSVGWMAGALFLGNVAIYVPGLLWLGQLYGWDKPILEWGLYPFLAGDALKLALAAVLMPLVWRMVGDARG